MNIKITPATDLAFALQLTYSNMLPYYQTRQLAWEADNYRKAWQNSENFDIYCHEVRVGSVRLEHEHDATWLADLQIVPHYQGQGIGNYVLDYMLQLTKLRQKSRMYLMVFPENPAYQWYQQWGFQEVKRDHMVIYMQKLLHESAPQ